MQIHNATVFLVWKGMVNMTPKVFIQLPNQGHVHTEEVKLVSSWIGTRSRDQRASYPV
jgi:hypothetical protein